MKKNVYKVCLTLILLVIVSNVFAITKSGTIDSDYKEYIYKGKNVSNKIVKATGIDDYNYYNAAAFYDEYIVGNKKEGQTYESNIIYTDSAYAKEACYNFINLPENKDKNYICKDPVEKNGYVCVDEGLVDFEAADGTIYQDVNVDRGKMFNDFNSCINSCGSLCDIKQGYVAVYQKNVEQTVSNEGEYNYLQGQYFVTEDGLPAFCIQPNLGFESYNIFTDTKKMTKPNYCLDDTFDLSVCNTPTGYNSDYRCGLANILLHGACGEEYNWNFDRSDGETCTASNNTFTANEYIAVDIALRLWAAYKANLRGTVTAQLPTDNSIFGDVHRTYIYGLTAKRLEENLSYATNGMECSKDSRNIGVFCTTTNGLKVTNDYIRALQLYVEALKAGYMDIAGNKLPTILTKTITHEKEEVRFTKPCDPKEDGCEIIIELYDEYGNKVAEDSPNCTGKNICTSKILYNMKPCIQDIKSYHIKIRIKNFQVGGVVRNYYDCDNPTNAQIMYTFGNVHGKDVIDEWSRSYEIKSECLEKCNDDKLVKQVHSTGLNENHTSLTSCQSSGKNDFGKGPYYTDDSGVEEITFADPSMSDILKSDCKSQYEKQEFSNNYCKVYCREATTLYIPNKSKVLSGMQFQYKLEEKIPNTGAANDEHITSIVRQTTECASEIDYKAWDAQYQKALSNMVSAWSDWRKYYVMLEHQSKHDDYPLGIYEGVDNLHAVRTCKYNFKDKDDYGRDYLLRFRETIQNDISSKINSGNAFDYGNSEFNGALTTNYGPYGICMYSGAIELEWKELMYDSYNYSNYKLIAVSGSAFESDGYPPNVGGECLFKYPGGTCFTLIPGSHECSESYSTSRVECESRNGIYIRGICTVTEKCNNDAYKPLKIEPGSSFNPFACKNNLNEAKKEAKLKCTKNNPLELIDKCYEEDTTVCVPGRHGDINKVARLTTAALANYKSAVGVVNNLLIQIQQCDFYGTNDWIKEDSDILNYSTGLIASSGGSTVGVGGLVGVYIETSNPTIATQDVNKSNVMNYTQVTGASSTLYDEEGNKIDYTPKLDTGNAYNDYLVMPLASASTPSIKRRVLQRTAMVNRGSIPILSVSYGDSRYGKEYIYPYVANVIDNQVEGGLINIYHMGGNDYNTSSAVKERNVSMVFCTDTKCTYPVGTNIVALDSYDLSGRNNGNNVSFTVTSEIMYYRDMRYFAEAYTGDVREVRAETKVDPKKFLMLDNGVYPVSTSAKTGLYNIHYTFKGLSNGKYKNTQNYGPKYINIEKDTYEYDCAYDNINMTQAFNCENVKAIDCVYTKNTVPSLECLVCRPDDAKSGFEFKNVDLEDLFPNKDRPKGYNWQNQDPLVNRIQNNKDALFNDPCMYELGVTLTPTDINKIREYNKNKIKYSVGGYQDNSLSGCQIVEASDGSGKIFTNCKSSFIKDLLSGTGALGIDKSNITLKYKGGICK